MCSLTRGPCGLTPPRKTYLSRGSIHVVFLLLWSMKYSFPSKSVAKSHPSGKGISPFLLLGIFHWLNPFKRITKHTRELATRPCWIPHYEGWRHAGSANSGEGPPRWNAARTRTLAGEWRFTAPRYTARTTARRRLASLTDSRRPARHPPYQSTW